MKNLFVERQNSAGTAQIKACGDTQIQLSNFRVGVSMKQEAASSLEV